MTEATLLLIGADGMLGRAIAHDWLQAERGRLILWVRAATVGEFEHKLRALRARHPSSRCQFAWGDLRAPEPFAGLDCARITHIVHAAALTRFNITRLAGELVNVEGTQRVLELAARCPQLRALDLLSTVYAAGLHDGLLREDVLLGERSFANEYERSKARMEALLYERHDLPWRIHRIATVIADDRSGHGTQSTAFHQSMRLLYGGWLPLLPGHGDTLLHVVDAASVVQALRRLSDAPTRAFYHLSAHSPLGLGELLRLAFEEFRMNPDFWQRRILEPPLCDHESFQLLCSGVSSTREPLLREALDSVALFARQLYTRHELEQSRTLRALGDPEFFGDSEALLRATLRHLVRERWGGLRHVA